MKRQLSFLRLVTILSLFLFFTIISYAQNGIPVIGKVEDNTGKGIDGATVHVKGGTVSTVTKTDGSFQITVPTNGSVLVISHVGFEEQQVTVKGNTAVSVAMKPNSNSMDEVVVIGYGTSKRREITGAVASISGKGIEEKPITRVDQALIGQMAGVQVRQQSGLPGQGLSVQIRGAGSISAGTEPLYVIDGFPLDVSSQNSAGGFSNNPLNNLNPDDIESISVLKDASAAAIYGSRAANGVVLITTKRGQTGRAKIGVNVNTGVSQVSRKLDVLSPEEWIAQSTELANYKWVNSGAGRTADQTNDQRRAILGLAPGAYNTNYMADDRWFLPGHPGLQFIDWQDEAFRKAPFQNYQVSASGGTDAVHYFFSGGYINQNGTLLNSGFKNYSARANVEVNASKRLKIGLNLAPSYSETNTPSAEGKDNQLMKLFNMTPVVEDSAGLNTGAGKNAVYSWASSSVSPVAYLNNSVSLAKTSRTLYTLYGDLQIIKGLNWRSTLNYDDGTQNVKKYTSDYVAGNVTNYLNSPGKSSSGSYSGNKKQVFLTEHTLSYNTTIHDDHSISAVAGMSYNYAHLESFSLSTAGGFANDIVQTLNNAIASTAGVTVTGNTTETNNTLLSYYARGQYSYKNKYILQASFRRDASSRFGTESRWGTFPSLSVGWRISDEKFMQGVTFVNDLKLRAAYGRSGNNNIGDYSAIPTISSAGYSFGGNSATAATGAVPNGLPNPTLHWETSNTYNAGLDATFLQNRLSLIVDAYLKKSSDLLLNVPVPAASGSTSILTNIGSVLNRGVEITLNSTNARTRDFQWTTSANISFNHNEVTALGPGQTLINVPSGYSGNPPFLLQVGLPMYSFYLVKTTGILTDKEAADNGVAKLSGETAGDEKYLDANGDGKIDASDRVLSGQPNPKFIYGLTNTFRYKAFDLSVQIYGQQGGSIYSFLARAIDNPANGRNTTLGVWRDRWTPENQNYSAPRGKIGYNYTIPLFTTDWLYSTDFFRIQDITLGYNLKSVVKYNFLNGARVYVSLYNWFNWDKYKGGVNPEAQNTNVSGNGSFPLPGDYGAMPLSKTITFGINLTF